MADWILANENEDIDDKGFDFPLSLLQILKRRGVSEEEFEDFLSDKPKHTYDPFHLPDLQKACERIYLLCKEKKKICVYGDYDTDGVTSTALMTELLRKLSDNVIYYIPSRFKEGYGPNKEAFTYLKGIGVEVIITVDCGITSKDEIEYAKSIGIECIVTDHHILREGMLPDCLVINPHRSDSKYEYSDLSGCGVAFKFAQGLNRLYPEEITKSELNSLLDLVCISTIGDIVPLLSENRLLVKYGLNILNQRKRPGLSILLKVLEKDQIIKSGDISYTISPNINALGKIKSADLGVELLLSEKSLDELRSLAEIVKATNIERKAVQEETALLCRDVLSKENCGDYAPIIYAENAHEGVAGIVAGMLKEELGKPVCIINKSSDGSLKGSGRSVLGLNLHTLLEGCSEYLEKFGGHAGACGFTVKQGCLEAFRDKMQVLVYNLVKDDQSLLEKKIFIEKELSPDELTLDFAKCIERLNPFGEGNPVPIFCIKDAMVLSYRCIGVEGKHLSFELMTKDEISISCISFGGTEKYKNLLESKFVDVAGELSINEFRGKTKLQFIVYDIKENVK